MVISNRIGQLEYLTAEGIPAPHCFTTRLGGVSTGVLSSLNIGTSRGDDPANVLENYRILGRALGFSPENAVLARQVHSDVVHVASDRDRGAGLFAPKLDSCDALVTNTPGLALVVFTADCTPFSSTTPLPAPSAPPMRAGGAPCPPLGPELWRPWSGNLAAARKISGLPSAPISAHATLKPGRMCRRLCTMPLAGPWSGLSGLSERNIM